MGARFDPIRCFVLPWRTEGKTRSGSLSVCWTGAALMKNAAVQGRDKMITVELTCRMLQLWTSSGESARTYMFEGKLFPTRNLLASRGFCAALHFANQKPLDCLFATTALGRDSIGRQNSGSAVPHWQLAKRNEPIRVLQLKAPLNVRYSLVYQNVQSSTGSTLMAL